MQPSTWYAYLQTRNFFYFETWWSQKERNLSWSWKWQWVDRCAHRWLPRNAHFPFIYTSSVTASAPWAKVRLLVVFYRWLLTLDSLCSKRKKSQVFCMFYKEIQILSCVQSVKQITFMTRQWSPQSGNYRLPEAWDCGCNHGLAAVWAMGSSREPQLHRLLVAQDTHSVCHHSISPRHRCWFPHISSARRMARCNVGWGITGAVQAVFDLFIFSLFN